jgi:GAF domain-containing protein
MTPLDPTAAFAELRRIKLGETTLDQVLARVVELAKRTLPGAAEVSVTLVRGDEAHTAAHTGPLALNLDEAQYETGQGPALDAADSAATYSVPDLADEARWPGWVARAVEAGARSSLSVGLLVQQKVTGALNVYSADAKAFDDKAVRLAQTFAGYAAVALANAHLYDVTATLAEQLHAAVESRVVIEQAKGILMGQRGCTADEAFALLREFSLESKRKLRDVAVALVAEAPGQPS